MTAAALVGALLGVIATLTAQQASIAWHNRPSRSLARAQHRADWWRAFAARFELDPPSTARPLTPMPPPGELAYGDLRGLVVRDRGRTPTTAERYAELRALPAGRHRADRAVGAA